MKISAALTSFFTQIMARGYDPCARPLNLTWFSALLKRVQIPGVRSEFRVSWLDGLGTSRSDRETIIFDIPRFLTIKLCRNIDIGENPQKSQFRNFCPFMAHMGIPKYPKGGSWGAMMYEINVRNFILHKKLYDIFPLAAIFLSPPYMPIWPPQKS